MHVDVVGKLHPVATGPAAEIVAAHQAPQPIEFYAGYRLLISYFFYV